MEFHPVPISQLDLYSSLLLNRDIAEKIFCVPPLRDITVANVAILVYSRSDIATYDMEGELGEFYFTPNENWEPSIRDIVSKYPIPKIMQEKVIGLIKPLSLQHFEWKLDHFFIKTSFPAINYFCWTSEGTIDRLKTAKRLVHLTNLGFSERFIMACFYSLKSDLLQLWRDASETERRKLIYLTSSETNCLYFFSCHRRQIVSEWLDWIKLGTGPCPSVYRIFDTCKRIPVQSYFAKICSRGRISELLNEELKKSPKDACKFLKKLRRSYETVPFRTLSLFLEWPLQAHFNEMADRLWVHLNVGDFPRLLRIICDKIERNWNDFDYVHILNDFWEKSPSDFKEYVKKYSSFQSIGKYITM